MADLPPLQLPGPDGLPPGYRVVDAADPATRTGPWRNRLACEHSPYLRQHAGNPVDWWPWGTAAFDRARALDRPVFLSIGYAACHWCHVMERESFADPDVAAVLNDGFVSIKVDREELPEVDALYMAALVQSTGEGGWPASLWLDHEGRPYAAGTYYPPYFRYGTPAFRDMLRRCLETWQGSRASVEHFASRVQQALVEGDGGGEGEAPPAGQHRAAEQVQRGLERLADDWDERSAGFGQGARFPQVPRLDLFLEAGLSGDAACLERLRAGLSAIEAGGLHDHVGGGFHRYTVDPDWQVPHFEKMLADNALLARLFARGWKVLGDPALQQAAGTTLAFMERDLGAGDGSFSSSLDAEAGGVEGEPYTWTRQQLLDAVGPARARAIADAYGVGPHSNWEGPGCVLRRHAGDGSLLAGARRKLLAARDRRPQPQVDDKRVVAWNGMAASALAEAGRLVGHAPWLERAEALGDLLLAARLSDGCLPRLLPPTGGAAAPAPAPAAALRTGVIEDQAQVLEALLDLHRATGLPRFLAAAVDLAAALLDRFTDPDGRGLLQAPVDRPGLFLRRVAWEDGAEPSGCALALLQLLRLDALDAGICSRDRLRALLVGAAPALADHPHGLPTTLRLLRRLDLAPHTVVIAGRDCATLHHALRRQLLLEVEVVVAEAGAALPPLGQLEGKSRDAPARAWRCEGTACSLPVASADGLLAWG